MATNDDMNASEWQEICRNFRGQCCRNCGENRYQLGQVRNVFENVYGCVRDIINNLANGDIKFPKTCCALPLFSFICKSGRNLIELSPPRANIGSGNDASELLKDLDL